MSLKKMYACLVASALVTVTQAVATPSVTPFLSVDINGANYGGGQTVGPTQAGFDPWNAFQGFDQLDPSYDPAEDWGNSGAAGLTKVFASPEGPITANLKGISPGSNLGSRNRGVSAPPYPLAGALQDMAFAQNSTTPPTDPVVGPAGGGFGQNFVRLALSGLVPGQRYQLTMLAREQAFNGADRDISLPSGSAQAWTDIAALGGLDGPGAWMNTNVGPNATYQGIYEEQDTDMDPMTPVVLVDTGYKNPIPTLGRAPISGTDHADMPYYYSVTMSSIADLGGNLVVYGWSDANTYGGSIVGSNIQRASLINGFQIGIVPEPSAFVLISIGLLGFLSSRRR